MVSTLVVGAAALGYAVAFLATPISARIAVRVGILDRPKAWYKGHIRPIPYLGGLAILAGTSAATGFVMLARDNPQPHWWGVLVGAALLALVGLVDDARELPMSVRFAAQLSAALAAWLAGFRVSLSGNEPIDLVLTLLWIVGTTNAFNLLDNMDGLTAGLGGVAALSFAALGLVAHLNFLAALAGGLAGACFGFLMHNKHPAKIFMGDSGSTYIGYLLALLGIALRFDNLLEVTFLIPVVVLGIPIMDTTIVVASRLHARRPVFQGGRDHISHRLVCAGLSVRAAVGVHYVAGICLGWLGLVISQSSARVGFMLLGFVVALGVSFGGLLWRVPVYDRSEEPVRSLEDLKDQAR